jgi:stage II sporulation protein D
MRVWLAAALVALSLPAAASAGTVFLLDGRGWGHGVGLSQWGAEGYARHGYAYQRILAHYYSGTQLAVTTPRQVRVLLAEQQTSIRIGSAAPFLVVDARGRKLHLPARSVVVDRRFALRGVTLRPPLRFEPGAQPLQLAFNGYRGDLVVKSKPDGLMVVNQLPLDRYLRGVVPWEAPKGWHEATYKAQAVAARSYTLATLHPGADFDLYSDPRSQAYGGIRAETPQTNLALGATAGQVLMWRGTIIEAMYFSSSGGRTSSVHDAFPTARQVPYLRSVPDPFDYISSRHVWPTKVLTPAQVGAALGVTGVRDVRVVHNSSGRAAAVRVLTDHGWQRFAGRAVESDFELGSADFDIHALTIDPPSSRLVFGSHVRLTGYVRGLGRARLQQDTDRGWVTLRPIHVLADGGFAAYLAPRRSTSYRLAYNGVAGGAVAVDVVPRVSLRLGLDGRLRALVSPALPLRVERLTHAHWRPVGRSTGFFERRVAPGSYRVAVAGVNGYVEATSRPVTVRAL